MFAQYITVFYTVLISGDVCARQEHQSLVNRGISELGFFPCQSHHLID